jgi:hypothetical protein
MGFTAALLAFAVTLRLPVFFVAMSASAPPLFIHV